MTAETKIAKALEKDLEHYQRYTGQDVVFTIGDNDNIILAYIESQGAQTVLFRTLRKYLVDIMDLFSGSPVTPYSPQFTLAEQLIPKSRISSMISLDKLLKDLEQKGKLKNLRLE